MHNSSILLFDSLMEGKPCVFKGEVLKQNKTRCPWSHRGLCAHLPAPPAPQRRVAHHPCGAGALPPGRLPRLPGGQRGVRAGHHLLGRLSAAGLAHPTRTRVPTVCTPRLQASGFPLQQRVSLCATHPATAAAARGAHRPPGLVCDGAGHRGRACSRTFTSSHARLGHAR